MSRMKGTGKLFTPGHERCTTCNTKLIPGLLKDNPTSNITPGKLAKGEYTCRECAKVKRADYERRCIEFDKLHQQIRAEISAMGPSSGPAQVQAEMQRQMERLSRPSGFNDWLEDQLDK